MFTDSEDIRKLFADYAESGKKIAVLDNELHAKEYNEEKWNKALVEKSRLMREYYQANQKVLEEKAYPYLDRKAEWNQKTAEAYLEECEKMLNSESGADFLLMDDVLKTVLDYFKKNDASKEDILRCSYVLVRTEEGYLWAEKMKEAASISLEATSDLSIYPSLSVDSRRHFIALELYAIFAQCAYQTMKRQFDFVTLKQQIIAFRERFSKLSPLLQDEKEKKTYRINNMNGYSTPASLVITFDNRRKWDKNLKKLTKEQEEARIWILSYAKKGFQERLPQAFPEEYLTEYSSLLDVKRALKEISSDEYLTALSGLYEKRIKPTSGQDLYKEDAGIYIIVIGPQLAVCLKDKKEDKKKNQQKIQEIFDEAIAFFASEDKGASNSASLLALNDYLVDMLPLIEPTKGLVDELFSLLFYQQTSTAIHSEMVFLISQVIIMEAFSKFKDVFKKTPVWNSSLSEEENKRNVFEYMRKAALMHDIGKTPFWDTVNMQKRKITDSEFALLKLHPRVGYEFLRSNKALEPYADVALLHHKWFDDSFGYPDYALKRSSPYQPFIDIISISDSIDAGTDLLGRNYTTGKTLEALLGELNRQKATRYSEAIVNLINESPSLTSRLNYLVTEGRKKVYLGIYMRFISAENKYGSV